MISRARAFATLMAAAMMAIGANAVAADNAGRGGKPALIRGVMNPQTGMFTAQPANVAAVDEANALALAATTVTGTISFTYNITLRTGFPESTALRCGLDTSTQDEAWVPEAVFYDTKDVLATRSGSTATCKISLFYSWLLPNPATTVLSMTYDVQAIPTTEAGVHRYHRGSVTSIKVPASGTTTSRTVNVTL